MYKDKLTEVSMHWLNCRVLRLEHFVGKEIFYTT